MPCPQWIHNGLGRLVIGGSANSIVGIRVDVFQGLLDVEVVVKRFLELSIEDILDFWPRGKRRQAPQRWDGIEEDMGAGSEDAGAA